jgi:hypothetical protein
MKFVEDHRNPLGFRIVTDASGVNPNPFGPQPVHVPTKFERVMAELDHAYPALSDSDWLSAEGIEPFEFEPKPVMGTMTLLMRAMQSRAGEATE